MKARAFALFLCLSLFVTSLTACNDPTMVNGVKIPAAAYEAGAVKLAFQDEFDSINTFDCNNTGDSGYNWYIDSDMNRTKPTTEDYTILKERDGAKGVLALEPVTNRTFDFATYSRKGRTGYLWHYGYAECRMRFDVENVPLALAQGGPREGWHSFWARDIRDYIHTGWKDTVELDMMEAWPFKVNYPEQGISFSGAIHHWIHHSVTGTGKNKDIPAPIAFGDFKGGRNQAYRIDSDWHTYGVLWKENYVAWYMDGKFMHAIEFGEDKLPVYYIGEEKREAVETANIFPGIFSVLNTQDMVITAGGGDTTWPQYIDFVRVWEFDD